LSFLAGRLCFGVNASQVPADEPRRSSPIMIAPIRRVIVMVGVWG
jgi:hypothetical protein